MKPASDFSTGSESVRGHRSDAEHCEAELSEKPLLLPEEIAGVLSGMVGAARRRALTHGPVPFSFREPLAIPREAEPAARRIVEAMAAAIERSLRGELGAEVRIEVDAFQQQRAAAAMSAVPTSSWLLSFRSEGIGGVALVLAPGTALSLLERVLGGTDSMSAARAPTALEARVMMRILPRMAAALSRALGVDLVPAPLGIDEIPEGVVGAGEVVGVGLLRMNLGHGEQSALMLASPPLLSGKRKGTTRAVTERIGAMAPKLEEVRIVTRPVLEAGSVKGQAIADLIPGSLLGFRVPANAPFLLRVGGKSVFTGTIVRGADGPGFSVIRRRGRTGAERE